MNKVSIWILYPKFQYMMGLSLKHSRDVTIMLKFWPGAIKFNKRGVFCWDQSLPPNYMLMVCWGHNFSMKVNSQPKHKISWKIFYCINILKVVKKRCVNLLQSKFAIANVISLSKMKIISDTKKYATQMHNNVSYLHLNVSHLVPF